MAVTVASELQGTIVGVFVEPGDIVRQGSVVALIESMKMHHEVLAPRRRQGRGASWSWSATAVAGGAALFSLEAADVNAQVEPDAATADGRRTP